MSETRPPEERTGKVTVHAQTHADLIIEEMVPNQPFYKQDCPSSGESWFRSAFRALLRTPVLDQVKTERGRGSVRHSYRVVPEAVREAREIREQREAWLPCGHSGVENLRNSAKYGCGFEGCDKRFVRDDSDDGFVEVAADE